MMNNGTRTELAQGSENASIGMSPRKIAETPQDKAPLLGGAKPPGVQAIYEESAGKLLEDGDLNTVQDMHMLEERRSEAQIQFESADVDTVTLNAAIEQINIGNWHHIRLLDSPKLLI